MREITSVDLVDGEAKGQATGRRKVGDCVDVVWVYPSRHVR